MVRGHRKTGRLPPSHYLQQRQELAAQGRRQYEEESDIDIEEMGEVPYLLSWLAMSAVTARFIN